MAKAMVTNAHPKKMPTKMPMRLVSERAENMNKAGQQPFKAVRPYERAK